MDPEKLEFLQRNAPCYLYDGKQIAEQCKRLRAAVPEAQFLYSIKTNPFAPVVQRIAAQGFGADAASANEVLRAAEARIPAEGIYWSAPGKAAEDLEKVWGRCTVIADSFSELALLEGLAAKRGETIRIGVRVNPDFSLGGAGGSPSKFGIDEAQLFASSLDFPHLKIAGIHVHLRSQVLDTAQLCKYYRDCDTLAERMDRLPGVEISFLNFGSGIGTVYDAAREKPLVLEQIGQTLAQLRKRSLKTNFLLETGRFVVCNAGTYYTRVVDRKVSHGKIFVVVRNAMNGFLRPAIAELLRQNTGNFPVNGQEPLYTSPTQCAFHLIGKDADPETVDVVGNLCTSLDVLARDIVLPRAEPGDLLEVTNAGSYGYTLTPERFSSHEPAREFLWE